MVLLATDFLVFFWLGDAKHVLFLIDDTESLGLPGICGAFELFPIQPEPELAAAVVLGEGGGSRRSLDFLRVPPSLTAGYFEASVDFTLDFLGSPNAALNLSSSFWSKP